MSSSWRGGRRVGASESAAGRRDVSASAASAHDGPDGRPAVGLDDDLSPATGGAVPGRGSRRSRNVRAPGRRELERCSDERESAMTASASAHSLHLQRPASRRRPWLGIAIERARARSTAANARMPRSLSKDRASALAAPAAGPRWPARARSARVASSDRRRAAATPARRRRRRVLALARARAAGLPADPSRASRRAARVRARRRRCRAALSGGARASTQFTSAPTSSAWPRLPSAVARDRARLALRRGIRARISTAREIGGAERPEARRRAPRAHASSSSNRAVPSRARTSTPAAAPRAS